MAVEGQNKGPIKHKLATQLFPTVVEIVALHLVIVHLVDP
jgi:hypothetical protein